MILMPPPPLVAWSKGKECFAFFLVSVIAATGPAALVALAKYDGTNVFMQAGAHTSSLAYTSYCKENNIFTYRTLNSMVEK